MKHFIVIAILLSGTAYWHDSIQNAHRLAAENAPDSGLSALPTKIGQYTQWGKDQETPEDVKTLLETSSILARTYRGASGRPIQVTIVYAGTTRRSLHFPEVCLVGQGWEIREQSTQDISFLFSATRLVLVKAQRNDAILYWFKTGDHFTGNFFENSWVWAKQQFVGGRATSAMIRISTAIGPDGKEPAFLALEDFAEKLSPALLDCMN